MNTLILHHSTDKNLDLSYQHGWVKAFKNSSQFNCSFINLANFRVGKKEIFDFKELKNYRVLKELIFNEYEIIIILHSAFSNTCFVPYIIKNIIANKKSYKVFFVGNEYKLMPEKIAFTKKLKINLMITQSLSQNIIDLYKTELNCDVIGLPSGGLDEDVFFPVKKFQERKIDIGYRTYPEPEYFGHRERLILMNSSEDVLKDLDFKFDFSMKTEDRFITHKWASFLNNCKSLVGSNTGFDYFDLKDTIRLKSGEFNRLQRRSLTQEAMLEKYFATFFKDKKRKHSMRIISGKNIEAAGCKTLQILVEGDYGNFFKPNIHYIKIEKDLSNLKECFEKLNDQNYCETIIKNAYNVVINNLRFTDHLTKLKNYIKEKI